MCLFKKKTKEEKLVGKVGFAETPFKPAGKISINGEIFDAISQGKYIEKGSKVKIVSVKSNKIVVKQI